MIADGPPRRVLEAIRDGRAELILPLPALDELRRVLRMKLRLDTESVTAIAALVEELSSSLADAPAEVPAVCGDPDDDRIIAAAVAAGADVLVSGDQRHVLPLMRVGRMRIMRPQDVLAEILD